MKKRSGSLSDSLVEDGLLTLEQLKKLQEEEKKTGDSFRKVLFRSKILDEDTIVNFLSAKSGIPRIDLENYAIDPGVIHLVPEQLARKYDLVPVLKIGNRLTCVMSDPWNVLAIDELRIKTDMVIEPALGALSEIQKAHQMYYGSHSAIQTAIDSAYWPEEAADEGHKVTIGKETEFAGEPTVVKLANLMFLNALREGASDIHLEPEEKELKVRFRVDGILHETPSFPKKLQAEILARIKVVANLDITDRRAAQDGRFNIEMEGRSIDVRVSCVPTVWGENIVLRLLDVRGKHLTLAEIGFSAKPLEQFEQLIRQPHGILLVTGPTGSGKTTTLYASLERINTVEKNIITIEDPVEYRIPGIRQMQTNAKVQLTFANGLRSILRQDPNIIMVGEIRDPETAKIAINAAQTGHLVLSTLHTNDAPGALTRLLDMGIEDYLIGSSLIGVLAQRLVRRICEHCKETSEAPLDTVKLLNAVLVREEKSYQITRGKGCNHCIKTGYRGRSAIFELMLINDKIKRAFLAKSSAPADDIRKLAIENGMRTLKQDGLEKALKGFTTVEEVLRVTQDTL